MRSFEPEHIALKLIVCIIIVHGPTSIHRCMLTGCLSMRARGPSCGNPNHECPGLTQWDPYEASTHKHPLRRKSTRTKQGRRRLDPLSRKSLITKPTHYWRDSWAGRGSWIIPGTDEEHHAAGSGQRHLDQLLAHCPGRWR